MDQLRGPVDRLGFSLYHAASEVVRATVGPGNEHRSFSLGVFSAASAAALIYVGSGGKTEANLHRILQLEHLFEGRCTPELIMIAFRQALAHLTKRPDKHFPLDESILYSGFQVYMANKAFFRTGTHCKSEFRDNIKQHFHMDMDEFEPLGRSEDVELTRQEINEWVRLQTHGKIPEMLPSLDLTQCLESSCVNMFLINASCMRAKWEKPFPRGGTQWRPFASSDGPSGLQTVQAEMMHITGNFPYFEDADLQVQYLEIAYVNREASLCVVLPKASKKKNLLLDLEKKLSYDSIIKLSTQKRLRTVNVFLPKFKVENTFDLKDLFMRTSMKSAFHEEADYSNMVESSEFHLAGAFHKSSIEIDEEGTFSEEFPGDPVKTEDEKMSSLHVPGQEGRGLSSRSSSFSSLNSKNWPEEQIRPTVADVAEFYADRPFLFAVRHNLSGLIIFVGRISTLVVEGQAPPKLLQVPSGPSLRMLSPQFLRKMGNEFVRRTRRDSD